MSKASVSAGSDACSACRADHEAAPGRYCAPLRCYCGHPECPAYAAGWAPVERLTAAAAREPTRLEQRALEAAQRAQEAALAKAPHPDVPDIYRLEQ